MAADQKYGIGQAVQISRLRIQNILRSQGEVFGVGQIVIAGGHHIHVQRPLVIARAADENQHRRAAVRQRLLINVIGADMPGIARRTMKIPVTHGVEPGLAHIGGLLIPIINQRAQLQRFLGERAIEHSGILAEIAILPFRQRGRRAGAQQKHGKRRKGKFFHGALLSDKKQESRSTATQFPLIRLAAARHLLPFGRRLLWLCAFNVPSRPCELSQSAMPDFSTQPRPRGSGQRSWTQGVRSTTEGEIFKGTDGACADPGTQNFPCRGARTQPTFPPSSFISLTFTSHTGSLLLSSLKKVTFPFVPRHS